jgi:glycosyltransferase involved in cell wall biosynthesis
MIDYPKILVILSPGFPANSEDSDCLPAQQSFIRSLNKVFPELLVVVMTFQYPHYRSVYNWHGNQVISFGGRNKKKLYRLLVWKNVWQQLKKTNEQRNIVGLLSLWCTETAFLAKLYARRNKLKHYCWLLGQDARKGNKMVTLINPQPKELIGLSDFLVSEFFRNYGILPAYMIPNGIDPESFPESPGEKDIDISGAGSLITLKRYDIFIQIIKKVSEAFPTLVTTLCGDGDEKIKLQSQIKELNLQENIKLTGKIPHQEVLKIMTRSKVFLHTSSYEGFSGVCLEALYAGAHVISFCYPITRNIDHWHVVSTEEEMITKTIELLQNPHTEYYPVLPFKMEDSAKAMMKLFFETTGSS